MAKNLTVETIDNPSLWDSFIASSPQGTVFSSTAWLRIAAAAQGGSPVCLGVMKDTAITAGISFIDIARGPFRKATTPVLTPFGGLMYRPDPGKRHSEAESFNSECARLLIEGIENKYSHSFFIHTPALTDIRPFSWRGWREKIRYTYLIDISDPDALWNLIERRVRTVIRNAETSLTLGGPIAIEEFIDLYKRIYGDRSRSLPVSPAVIGSMARSALGEDLGEMRTVRDETGTVVSSMILAPDRISGCVYAWISGSIPGENSSGAFSLLFWDAVRRYSGEYSHLDMVGANIESISFFKKGFGGTLTPYYVTEHFSSLFSRLAIGLYHRAHKLFV